MSASAAKLLRLLEDSRKILKVRGPSAIGSGLRFPMSALRTALASLRLPI